MRLIETFYPPTWRGRPASMPWTDWQIWQRFLASSGALYDSYSYDVMLSAGEPAPLGTDAAMLKMWRENTAKRIDAVGKKAGVYTIIEVRDECTWQTLGQVLGYQALAELEFDGDTWSRPLIVCGTINTGIRPAITAQGINLLILPPRG